MERALLALACIGLVACSDGGDNAATTVAAEVSTTAAPTTEPATTSAPTTTEAPTTTTDPGPTTTKKPAAYYGAYALVWESAVDPARVNQTTPQPTNTAKGVTVRLQVVGYVPLTATDSDARSACADEMTYADQAEPGCLVIQVVMDVAADYGADEATVLVDAVITPDGHQHGSVFAESAYAGTNGTTLLVVVPGVPGSTLKVQYGSNDLGFETASWTLPPDPWPEVSWM